jgi:phosphatidylserine/phosphatidylglycerophosphate/cardiolipin synthase-like enzyme
VREIGRAKQYVEVLAHRLSSPEIIAAIAAAKTRGVQISVILDGSKPADGESDGTLLLNAGLPFSIDAAHALAHNSVVLIDGRVIATGSFDFTTSAETSNSENLLVITERPVLWKAYSIEFDKHASHSTPYRRNSSGEGKQK